MKKIYLVILILVISVGSALAQVPFVFHVPLELRDMYREISGVDIECIVTTAQGATVASGKTRVPMSGGVLIETAVVEADFPEASADAMLPDAANYECSMKLTTPYLGRESMPPLAPGETMSGDAYPQFEAAPGTPFVKVVRGTIPSPATQNILKAPVSPRIP